MFSFKRFGQFVMESMQENQAVLSVPQDQVKATVVRYVPQSRTLCVGYNIHGAFQLFSLKSLDLDFAGFARGTWPFISYSLFIHSYSFLRNFSWVLIHFIDYVRVFFRFYSFLFSFYSFLFIIIHYYSLLFILIHSYSFLFIPIHFIQFVLI